MRLAPRHSLLIAFAVLLPANQSYAAGTIAPEAEPELDFALLERVGEEELREQRGGFTWQGVTIRFGAEIRTYLEDELVLHTLLNWTEDGPFTTQTASGALTPVDMAALQNGILSTGNITIQVGSSQVFLANEGRTALIHQTDDSVRNILINTAADISARQEVDATLDLSGYDAFRADLIGSRFLGQITDYVSDPAAGLLGN